MAVCVSPRRGTEKQPVPSARLVRDWGLEGDAHAGKWHRQVSLLSYEKIQAFRAKGAEVGFGAFGENLAVSGIDFRSLPVGTRLLCGDAVLEVTQIGKECHSGCAIFQKMGECIMPREGVFARVLRGGTVSVGDEMTVENELNAGESAVEILTAPIEMTEKAGENKAKEDKAGENKAGKDKTEENKAGENKTEEQKNPPFRAFVLTASDAGYRGEREDRSGPEAERILREAGYSVTGRAILPDDRESLAEKLREVCDSGKVDLLVTTGGTGFSPRDCTPEATADVIERPVPGIPEAMRLASMRITPRGMLSRAAAGIRGGTLIVNLPGSPKAVRECLEAVLPALGHGLAVLRGGVRNCAGDGETERTERTERKEIEEENQLKKSEEI